MLRGCIEYGFGVFLRIDCFETGGGFAKKLIVFCSGFVDNDGIYIIM